jgi:hypothetical protein
MPRTHSETRREYWRVVKGRFRADPGTTTRLLATCHSKIFVQSLARHLRQLEPDWPIRPSLTHSRPVDRVPVGRDVVDNEVAAAQLAVDRKIEIAKSRAPLQLRLVRMTRHAPVATGASDR